MYTWLEAALLDEMGPSISRLEIDSDAYDSDETVNGSNGTQISHEEQPAIDNEISHATKVRSAPSEMIRKVVPSDQKLPISTVRMLSAREANYSGKGRFSSADCCHVSSRYLPINGPGQVDAMNSRAYVSQFSADGTLFIAGFQGSHIRIYDVDNRWKVKKDILARSLRWTVTDTSLSPDQRYLVYSSMTPLVHIVNVGTARAESYAKITEIHDGLDFASAADDGFGIFSVKFSTDGRELVTGSSDNSIYVYDLEANKLALRFVAHSSHVNTVCFGDETGHLIYSGSDDNLCKSDYFATDGSVSDQMITEVWDRRCFNSTGMSAGVLMGHLEGITFIDSRGDGRYFISNGKDQMIKLWDMRKMTSNAICPRHRNSEWDYRWMDYPSNARDQKHPCDQSLATYTGHSVLRTLIRCYFSPVYSTGQKYIYTGSNDGSVYIYDVVTGSQLAKLMFHASTVRDCNWHPFFPILVSSSWDGVIARWEFPGSGSPLAASQRKSRRRNVY